MALSRPAILASIVTHGVLFVAAAFVYRHAAAETRKLPAMAVETRDEAREVPEEDPIEEVEDPVEPEIEPEKMQEVPELEEPEPRFEDTAFVVPIPDPEQAPEPLPQREPWLADLSRPKNEKTEPRKTPTEPPEKKTKPSTAAAQAVSAIPGKNPPPDYPRIALRRRLQGWVLVHVHVDAQGGVVHCSVKKSSGHKLLDKAALNAVRAWKFAGGPGETDVPIRFRLSDAKR